MTFKEAFTIFHRDYSWWENAREVHPTQEFLRRFKRGMRDSDYPRAEQLLMKIIPAIESVFSDNRFCETVLRDLGDINPSRNPVPALSDEIKRLVQTQLRNHNCQRSDIVDSSRILYFKFSDLKSQNKKAYDFYKALNLLLDLLRDCYNA